MLYFSVGSDKETRPRRRRTEGLVLTPITSRGKLRLAPGVLFPILRYLQGTINKLLPETAWGMKGTECRGRRKTLRWKVCLKCVAPRILRRRRDSESSPGVPPADRRLCIRHFNAKSSRPHEWSAHIAPLLYIAGQVPLLVELLCSYKKKNDWNASFAREVKWGIFLQFYMWFNFF